MPVMRKVPLRSCQMPNCGSAKSGPHDPSVTKRSPTSSKKESDSASSAKTIPIVVRIEIAAARKRRALMASSPQRLRCTPSGISASVARDRGCRVAGLALVHRDDQRCLGDDVVIVYDELHEPGSSLIREEFRRGVHVDGPGERGVLARLDGLRGGRHTPVA